MSPLRIRRRWVLVAVAILLAAALWGIPALIHQMQRGKRKRAMGEIRSLASTVQAYAADHGAPPPVPDGPAGGLGNYLAPAYTQEVPTNGVWGVPHQYYRWTDGEGQAHFQLICVGGDGRRDQPGRYTGPGPRPTGCYEDDIVWQDDRFLVWPEGPQKRCRKE